MQNIAVTDVPVAFKVFKLYTFKELFVLLLKTVVWFNSRYAYIFTVLAEKER